MSGQEIRFGIKITGDGKELVGEVKLSRDELDKLGQSTRNAGSEAARLNQQNKSLAASFAEQAEEMAKAAVSLAAIHGTIKSAIRASNEYTAAITGLASVSRHAGEDIQQTLNRATALTSDGLLSVSESALALKNLLARGFTTDQAVQMIERFKDSAAFGRQASLDFGQAVVSATEGIKNENSILVDNAGVTKNVSVMWKEYAAQIGVSVDHLTQAQKRQAEYNGILAETEGQLGNAAIASGGLMGAQARMDASIKASATALGQSLTPAVTAAANGLEYLSENAVKPIIFGMEALGIKAAETASKVSLTLSFLTSPDKWSGGLAKWINSPEYKAQIAALEKLSSDMLTASAGRISGATGPEAPNIGADSGARRADVVLNGKAEASRKAAKGIEDAATVAAKAYATLIKSGQEYTTQLTAEYEGHEKLSKSAKLLAEARATLPPGLLMAVEAELSWAQALESSIDAEKRDFEQAQATHKARLAAVAELNRAEAERIDALNKSVASAQADAVSQREAYETYGMSAAAVREMTAAKLEARLVGLDFASSTIEEVTALEAQIKALKEASLWASKTEVLDANKRAAEESTRDWERMTQQVGQSLTDEIMRGGKNAGELLEDYFRTLVLRPIIQGVVNLGMSAVGMGPDTATAGTNYLGMASNASSAYTLYGTAQGYYGAYQAGAGLTAAQAAEAAAAYNSAGYYGTAASLQAGAAYGTGAATSADIAVGAAANSTAWGGTGAATTTAAGSGTGSMAALGWIGAAIIAAYLIHSGTQGETRQGQRYAYGPGGLRRTEGPSGGDIGGEQMLTATQAIIDKTNVLLWRYSQGTSLTGFQSALESSGNGRGGVYAGGTLSTGATYGESGVGSNYRGDLYERWSTQSPDSGEAARQYALDMSQSILQALRAADVGGEVGALLAGTIGDVTRDVARFVGDGLGSEANYSEQITETVDQIEQLTQQQADTIINVLSAPWSEPVLEQVAKLNLSLSGTADYLIAVGQRMPAIAQQFNLTADKIGSDFHTALTESASAAEAGAIFADGVLGGVYGAMQAGYEQQITGIMMDGIINPVLIAVATGAQLSNVLTDQIISDAVARMDAMASAYNALMSSPEFTGAMDRLQIATSQAGAAAYRPQTNYYQPYVRPQSQPQPDTRAADDAARTAADLARSRRAMEIQIMELTGDTAAALAAQRADELAGMDASLRPLQQRINALTDEQRITEARTGWQERLDVLTGARTQRQIDLARDLAGVTDTATIALIEQVYAQGDLADAAQRSAEAIKANMSWHERLDVLTGARTQRQIGLANDLAGVTDTATQALIRQVYAVEGHVEAVNLANAALTRAADAERKRLQGSRATADESLRLLSTIFDMVDDGARTLRGQASSMSAFTLREARAYIDMAQSLVAAGGRPDDKRISQAIQALATDSVDNYASMADYEYAQLVQAGKLDTIGRTVGAQKTIAEQQLDAMDAQLAALDDQLQAARDQIDAINGVDTSVVSVAAAIAGLGTALAGLSGARSTAVQANPGNPSIDATTIRAGVQWVADRHGGTISDDIAARDLYDTALQYGVSSSQLAASIGVPQSMITDWVRQRGLPAFASGGFASPGAYLAGENGPELIVAPVATRIFNAGETAALGGGNSDALIRELIAEVRRLEARLARIESNTGRTPPPIDAERPVRVVMYS